MGDSLVKVYNDTEDPIVAYAHPAFDSYKESTSEEVTYSEFIQKISKYT